jgi:hypothetical protein
MRIHVQQLLICNRRNCGSELIMEWGPVSRNKSSTNNKMDLPLSLLGGEAVAWHGEAGDERAAATLLTKHADQ